MSGRANSLAADIRPGYWMFEESGILAPVVHAYLRGEALNGMQIAIMRAYLRQWIAGDFRGPEVDDLRARVNDLTTREAISRWLYDADCACIDPL
jgi:hypothetical protein